MEPISDFSISISSIDRAYIYYMRGDEEIEKEIEITIEYEAGEPPSHDSPGCPPDVYLDEVFGLTIEERHAYDEWMAEYGGSLEPEMFEVVEQKIIDDDACYADDRHQQMKDRRIEENL